MRLIEQWLDEDVAPLIEQGIVRSLIKQFLPTRKDVSTDNWASIEDAFIASAFSNLARIGRSIKSKHQVIPALRRVARRVSAEMRAEIEGLK